MEGRDVAVADTPGAFINAFLDKIVHMKLEGILADSLEQIAPDVCGPAVGKNANGKTVLCVRLTRALHGCLKSSMHFWRHLSTVLHDKGFIANPCDPCVVNKVINGKQCTITWHADDLKISHEDKRVVDDAIKHWSPSVESSPSREANITPV